MEVFGIDALKQVSSRVGMRWEREKERRENEREGWRERLNEDENQNENQIYVRWHGQTTPKQSKVKAEQSNQPKLEHRQAPC